MMVNAKVGDVIQVNENGGSWCGCLMIVNEIKSFGVMAGMKIPFQGTAYLRLKHDQYSVIGIAEFVEGDVCNDDSRSD